MKVLVVDDSRVMRMILIRTLTSMEGFAGATVLEAADGREALDVVEAERPDLVLSDWNMPLMDGIDLLEALHARGLETTFGFVTSESTPQMHDRAIAAGASFVVSKPFTPESLARALTG